MRRQALSSALRALSALHISGASALPSALPLPISIPAIGTTITIPSRAWARSMSSFGGADPQRKMHCYQTPEVAGLQDLLVYSIKGLGSLAHKARAAGIEDAAVNSFIMGAMFSTLTNVNFSDERFHQYIHEAAALHAKLAARLGAAGKASPAAPAWLSQEGMPHPSAWNVATAAQGPDALSTADLVEVARKTGIVARQEALGKTTAGLQELIVYGLKGTCAYAVHAEALGSKDPAVYAAIQETLDFLTTPAAAEVPKLLENALKVGSINFRVMQMLSEAHAGTFGHPVPTEVPLTPVAGKCILVTGHDMHDLHLLLEQTAGKGINVYTHGEMLPAHSYPGLKKYTHLVGHFGGAWYQQKKDFSYFPGSILVTTNCVLEPMTMYKKNIFTTNETGLAGITHLGNKDFTPLIDRANQLSGFDERAIARTAAGLKKNTFTVGFGHNNVLSVAGQVIDAVKTGKLSHIFLVGGCDGHEPQRDYYSGLGKELPKDTMLLTLGCGKFRINDQELGTLPGTQLPRMLDMGQCNDAYSALVVATELAKAFNTDVNSLPLSLDISWFEQKAVAVLLTLLSLGVKNIRLGPVLPAFLTPEAVSVLVEKFALKPADTSNPGLDLKKMLSKV